MELTAVSRAVIVLAGMAWSFSALQIAGADELSAISPASQASSQGPDIDRGHLIWAMLEAIERQHYSPPTRLELMGTIARVLLGFDQRKAGGAIVTEGLEALSPKMLQCESAQELSDLIEGWDCPAVSIDQFALRLNQEFGLRFGDLRLVRTKDHDVQEQFRGNRYVGLGVNVRIDETNQFLVFVAIVPGGPADRGGLKPGTIVREIAGQSTEKQSMEILLERLRGPQGSDVTLKVSAPGASEAQLMTLRRSVIRFDSLKNNQNKSLKQESLRIESSQPIGWITVGNIKGSTLQELRMAEIQSKLEGVRVLILDFRQGDGSGDLHQALLIADSFLDGGAIWERSERSIAPRTDFADRECLFRGIPLVILVSQLTGPEHCAIAAALQDGNRAKIVGDYPKFDGVLEGTVPLEDVPYLIAMKTTRLRRPRGGPSWPLQPDVLTTETLGTRLEFPEEILKVREAMALQSRANRRQTTIQQSDDTTLTDPTVTVVPQARSLLRRINFERQHPIRPSPLVQRPSADEVAVELAKQLLDGLPSERAQ